MGRDQNKPGSSGNNLLNFHFTTGPPPPSQQNQRRRNNQGQNFNNHQYNNRRRNHNKNSQPRQRKPNNSHLFNLHSSADHAFILTRRGLKNQQHSFTGSDEAVSWESVRIVKCLVSTSDNLNCPICLDEMTCPRITKCGHVYCLPCLLRHIQVHAQSNLYHHVKCPCCALPLHTPDLRPVVLVTILPPRLHQKMKLVKLHRSKNCPAPFLPTPETPRRSSSHAAPCVTDADGAYSRFNYVDPTLYQQHLVSNKVELEMELSSLTQQRQGRCSKFLQQQANLEAIFVTSSLDIIKREIDKAVQEFAQETEWMESHRSIGSGVAHPQPPHLLASSYEFTVLRDRGNSIASETESLTAASVDLENLDRHRGESVGSEGEARRYRGDSISSYASASVDESVTYNNTKEASTSQQTQQIHKPKSGKKNSKCSKPPRKFPKASMYLDDEGSTHFYQTEDGQLCFLSRFNMNCLLSDFSAKVPGVSAEDVELNYWQRRKLLPLPDAVEGEILEIESINLSPETRKRMPFLAHLPLYTDIHFVELDLNNLLSMDTKRIFKADFEKRRKKRQGKVKAEKREDKLARLKEEERINELKARMQQIDPNDEFFQVSPPPEEPLAMTGEAFGPAISAGSNVPVAATSANNAAFSFSSVLSAGGAFPSLTSSDSNFPALGSSPPARRGPEQVASSWGSPSRSKAGATAVTPPVQAPSSPAQVSKQQPQLPGAKKKSKGKKIVLFSTGGQRGTSY